MNLSVASSAAEAENEKKSDDNELFHMRLNPLITRGLSQF